MAAPGADTPCPLCGRSGREKVDAAFGRTLWLCDECLLLAVAPADRPGREAERRRYELHHNAIEDAGYVAFLERLLDPVAELLTPGARGLDFGCGPQPVLAELARRRGFACDTYDPLFHPDPPQAPYRYVLASEVFEHLHEPAREIERLVALVAPGGILGVMTERWRSREQLPSWTYLSDPTHVCFFHDRTMAWIAGAHGLEIVAGDAERVTVFRRRGGGPAGLGRSVPYPTR